MAGRTLRRGSSMIEDISIRVEDYLNDKLQTHADLENLDTILQNVRQQQELLRKQLSEAESEAQAATQSSKSQKLEIAEKTQWFRKQQGEIDRRLLIVTQSDTSDVAVAKFSETMDKLTRLDVAKGYTELLSKTEKLSAEARRNFKSSPQAALEPYLELKSLANTLKKAQPAADGAAPHLVDHVEKTTTDIWTQMKNAFASKFEETLKKMKWPGKDVSLEGGLRHEWSEGVVKLLQLQGPELEAYEAESTKAEAGREELVLLPLEVMIKPLALRFKYHFEGNRPTNKLDKPEYFLSHVADLLNTYEGFFSLYLQPILQQHLHDTNLALNPLFIDSTTALIAAMLPMIREKLAHTVPQAAHQPQLLSHLIHELMSFDRSIIDDWGYDGGAGAEGWKGLTWEVLSKGQWFNRWLKVEKDFALARYESIIGPDDSGELDFDSVDPGTTKPTKAAIRVNDLLETITERYRPLNSLSQKLRFLIDIQIAIFDLFHDWLHSSLERYQTIVSSLGRSVTGVSKEVQASLRGLAGLDRLCRVYGSADYLEHKMRDWGYDVFFLELWDELQHRIRANTTTDRNVAGDMKAADVAEKTSSSVTDGDGAENGTLFDETSFSYRRTRIRTEEIMITAITDAVSGSLKPYSRINPWALVAGDTDAAISISVTAELDGTLQLLHSYLGFLSKALADAPLRRIARQVGLHIQTFFWDSVLMRNNFSASGIAQLQRDLSALWAVIDKYAGNGHGRASMRRLKEAVELLALPPTQGQDEKDDKANGIGNSAEEIEKMIFTSNEEAREALDGLGLEALSETDARNVLKRKVNIGN